MKTLNSRQGFTLVEAIVGLALSAVVFSALVGAMLAIRSTRTMAQHYSQATNVVRGEIETLKAMPFAQVGDQDGDADGVDTQVVAYDAGPDGLYGTGDDFTGTLTVQLGDFVDFDADGDTVETQIDVNDDAVNDTITKPVRVTFQWSEHLLGPDRNFSITVHTLIIS